MINDKQKIEHMKKINFKAIEIEDIEKNIQTIDIARPLGNQLYLQGQDIKVCDLGRDIYYSDGEMELTDEQVRMVLNAVRDYPFVTRTAIAKALKNEDWLSIWAEELS